MFFILVGVIAGTYYKNVFWGFFAGIVAGAIPYYLFYRKQIKDFDKLLGEVLV